MKNDETRTIDNDKPGMGSINRFEESVMQMRVFTERQRRAARFLIGHRLRLMVDFGVANCEAIATRLGWQES